MTQTDRETARAERKQALLDSPERAWVLAHKKELEASGVKYFTAAECLFVHGMSVQATAERMGVTFDQVRQRKWRLQGMMDWCGVRAL